MHPLSVTRSRAAELEKLSSVNTKLWKQLLKDLADAKPVPLTVEELSSIFASRIGENGATLAAVAISLRRLADQEGKAADTVLDALKRGLLRQGWGDDKIKKWSSIEKRLAEVIDHDAVEIVTKSSDLYYRHSLHIHSLKIITDMRPVFDAERSDLISIITMNMLSITYSDVHESEKTITLAIGMDELSQLKREADNALEKSEKLAAIVNEKLGVLNRYYK